jgi:hypothetical protein
MITITQGSKYQYQFNKNYQIVLKRYLLSRNELFEEGSDRYNRSIERFTCLHVYEDNLFCVINGT